MRYPLMELSELPVIQGEGCVRFIVPIHPVFISKDISLDPNLANEIFTEAKIEAQRRLTSQEYEGIIDSCYDRPSIRTDDRGFAKVLTTNGGIYASLFFNIETPYTIQFYRGLYTGSKLDSYRTYDKLLYGYDRHNVDSLVQATMLQTWAVMYLNKVLEFLE